MASNDAAEAARRRAERRARIRMQINELQSEIDQLEGCKRELFVAKSNLASAEAKINSGMQVTENVNTNLCEQYAGKRVEYNIVPYIMSILARKGAITSSINSFRNELNIAINDLNDAINCRESKIAELYDSL